MDVHVEIAAETLFEVGPVAVTNSMVTMFAVMGLILFGLWLIARRLTMVPGRGQGVVEMVVEFLLGLVESSAGRTAGRRIFPLIGGIFIFIALSNYSGLLPGVGTIGTYHYEEEETTDGEANVDEDPDSTTVESPGEGEGEAQGEDAVDEGGSESSTDEGSIVEEGAPGEDAATEEAPALDEPAEEQPADDGATSGTLASVGASDAGPSASAQEESEEDHGEEHKVLVPFLRAPNADLNMTLAMALVTFTAVQILGVRKHGFGGRIKHMANPPFLFPIELISEFSRIISLSARLFGNVFAGEVLLGVMYAMAAAIKIALIPVIFPVVFLFLELLFGSIQALVFALLTLIYITLATEGGHEDHAQDHVEGGEFGVADSHGHAPARAAGHAD